MEGANAHQDYEQKMPGGFGHSLRVRGHRLRIGWTLRATEPPLSLLLWVAVPVPFH